LIFGSSSDWQGIVFHVSGSTSRLGSRTGKMGSLYTSGRS